MVQAGELTNDAGVYELAGRLRARRQEQEFAIAPRFVDDGGAWTMHLAVAEGRSAVERSALRAALRHARFAERRAGVWLRPANLAALTARQITAQCETYRVFPDDSRRLAALLFEPEEWAAAARQLRATLRGATRSLPRDDAIAPAFIAGAQVAAHLRADPLLPEALLPPRWPGEALRRDYVEYLQAFSAAAQRWFAGR
jgi:phenylacetic acid degradation operon negative regulatory protein